MDGVGVGVRWGGVVGERGVGMSCVGLAHDWDSQEGLLAAKRTWLDHEKVAALDGAVAHAGQDEAGDGVLWGGGGRAGRGAGRMGGRERGVRRTG